MRIDACYDSHVHWAATGEFSERLSLDGLHSPAEIKDLAIERRHYRGDWLLGFGWDDSLWRKNENPTLELLDELFPNFPVALTRCDAHALWVNTQALQRAGLWRAASSSSTSAVGCVLVDDEREAVERLIPKPQSLDMRRYLLKAMQTFNTAGITHIRDMTGDEPQWCEALKLDSSGLLTLAVEQYFWLKDVSELGSLLDTMERLRTEQTPNLRIKGIKVFLDGALGSEGAYLSRFYGRDGGGGYSRSSLSPSATDGDGSGSPGQRGKLLWQRDAVGETMIRSWERGFEVAVHALGDEAVDWLISLALELKEKGFSGKFHVEHAQVLRSDTIGKMKALPLECHLQPSHWLRDRQWMNQKIGDLAAMSFPWRRLQESGIAFDFGSDSPIEPPSLSRTLQALRESADAGVPRLLGLPLTYMGHRDLAWAPNSFTLLEEDVPAQVIFRGEHLN